MIGRAYLALYNLAQTALWSICLYKIGNAYLASETSIFTTAPYEAGKEMVEYAQGLASLEILHALIGLAGGAPLAVSVQSRVHLSTSSLSPTTDSTPPVYSYIYTYTHN